jgi:hypothetical protein
VNVKEYIRSGVIESYVLGLATEAERQEFEQMCAAYPEVAEARDAFERSLEEQLMPCNRRRISKKKFFSKSVRW